jgi:hypothetical protein
MLFKVRDKKGVERWVNPIYVRVIRQKKNTTELWISGEVQPLYLDQPLDTVANVVNAAMPIVDALPAEAPDAANQTEMLTMLASGVI